MLINLDNLIRDREAISKSSRRTASYHLLRIAVFAAAVICAVCGILLLTERNNTQVNTEMVTLESIARPTKGNVLLLLSYDDSDATSNQERAGVLDYLRSCGVGVDVEYMDCIHNEQDATTYKTWEQYFLTKAQNNNGYDAIICADDDALEFVIKHHGKDGIFAKKPVVFFGASNDDLAQQAVAAGWATGFTENGAVEAALDNALATVPKATQVCVISDNTPTGLGRSEELSGVIGKYSNISFTQVNVENMTRGELTGILESLTPDTIVLYLSAAKDCDGILYSHTNTVHYITEHAPVPVFGVGLEGVGEGLLGSASINYEDQGTQAAKTLVTILNGTLPSNIAVSQNATISSVFDYNVIKQFGLSKNDVPSGAVLINHNGFDIRALTPLILPLLLLVAAAIFVVFFARMGYRRSLNDARAIIRSRNDLQHRYYHDNLTNLPNRQALDYYLAHVSSAQLGSFCACDIDGFGDLNDSYGHAYGDVILQTVAQRLVDLNCLLCFRLGADEFFVIFDKPLSAQSKELRQLRTVFSEPIEYNDLRLDLSASVGVVNIDHTNNTSLSTYVSYTDLALRDALHEFQRGGLAFYRSSLLQEVNTRLDIVNCLKTAIVEKSFNVLYQPQVDVQTLKVYGYECLVRLANNAYYPDKFIPVAETSGLIIDIDRIITEKAIAQMAKWRSDGHELGVMSINFSAGQIKDTQYPEFLAQILNHYQIDPHLIKIEITESMMFENEAYANNLFSRIKDMGVSFALDDFGTGYSSLYRISNSPVEYVKFDKSLADTFLIEGKESFIAHLTDIMHELDKKIIVEGVETPAQYAICKRLGCDIIQGYVFSKPLSADEAITFTPHPFND